MSAPTVARNDSRQQAPRTYNLTAEQRKDAIEEADKLIREIKQRRAELAKRRR